MTRFLGKCTTQFGFIPRNCKQGLFAVLKILTMHTYKKKKEKTLNETEIGSTLRFAFPVQSNEGSPDVHLKLRISGEAAQPFRRWKPFRGCFSTTLIPSNAYSALQSCGFLFLQVDAAGSQQVLCVNGLGSRLTADMAGC